MQRSVRLQHRVALAAGPANQRTNDATGVISSKQAIISIAALVPSVKVRFGVASKPRRTLQIKMRSIHAADEPIKTELCATIFPELTAALSRWPSNKTMFALQHSLNKALSKNEDRAVGKAKNAHELGDGAAGVTACKSGESHKNLEANAALLANGEGINRPTSDRKRINEVKCSSVHVAVVMNLEVGNPKFKRVIGGRGFVLDRPGNVPARKIRGWREGGREE